MTKPITTTVTVLTQFIALLICTFTTTGTSREVNDLGKLDDWRCDPNRKAEIAVAQGTFIYAIASDKAYDRKDKDAEAIPFPKNSRWDLIWDSTISDETIGFYAKAWIHTLSSGKREVVISFRGTKFSELSDWTRSNYTTIRFVPWRTQQDAALEFAAETIRRPECADIPVILTGHSLGGGLAEYCQRFIKGSVAIVFDPSPNQGRIYSFGASGPLYDKNVLRVFERGEILRYTRWFALVFNRVAENAEVHGQSALWLNFSRRGLIGDHYIMPFANNLVRLSALHKDEGARSVLDQIAEKREQATGYPPVDHWWNRDLVAEWCAKNVGKCERSSRGTQLSEKR